MLEICRFSPEEIDETIEALDHLQRLISPILRSMRSSATRGEVLPRAPLDGAQIEALYKRGLSDEKIAKEMGCSLGSIANWRKRNGGLPPNGSRAAEPSASGGLPDVFQRIEAILSALPAVSLEATRAAACDLARCLLWDEMVRHGTGPASNELWGHNSA